MTELTENEKIRRTTWGMVYAAYISHFGHPGFAVKCADECLIAFDKRFSEPEKITKNENYPDPPYWEKIDPKIFQMIDI